jgi:mannosyltransferase
MVTWLLGVWAIGTPGPWIDEMTTIEALVHGLPRHLGEAPLLPYYALLWVWSLGGNMTTIEWLRLPSVLSLVVMACCVAHTARLLGTRRAGFVAGMIVALAPGLARYGHEARTYAVAAGVMSIATLALVVAVQSKSQRWWVVHGLSVGAAAVILPVSLAAVPAYAVILGGLSGGRGTWRAWSLCMMWVVPVVALEVSLALIFDEALRGWLPRPGVVDLAASPVLLVTSESTGQLFGLLVLVLGLTTAMGRRWIAGLFASVAVVWVTSVTLSSWWTARSFIPLAGLACVAAGLAFVERGWVWVAGVLAGLGLVAVPDQRAIREPGARGIDPVAIGEIMAVHARDGDAYLTPSDRTILSWTVDTYLRDEPGTFSRVTTTGRYWELSEVPTCARFDEWTLPGGFPLRLCLGSHGG